jgi:hypothetical protein
VTVANLDYFLTVNKELLGNIQNLLGFGSLPPLPEIPQIKQNTAKIRISLGPCLAMRLSQY